MRILLQCAHLHSISFYWRVVKLCGRWDWIGARRMGCFRGSLGYLETSTLSFFAFVINGSRLLMVGGGGPKEKRWKFGQEIHVFVLSVAGSSEAGVRFSEIACNI